MSLHSRTKTYLALLRFPNLFTVPLDPVAGAVCATGDIKLNICTAPAISVLFLYSAGLILSDYCDRGKDALERPERPIPSGEIRHLDALYAGIILLAAGLVAGVTGGWNAGLTAIVLAALILLYSLLHTYYKFTGALIMAGCRALAVLIGAAAAGTVWTAALPASVTFLYILLLTLCAIGEATRQSLPFYRAISPLLPMAVPLWISFASGVTLPSLIAVSFLSGVIISTLVSTRMSIKGKRTIPEHIGILVRNLIFIQGAWITLYLSDLNNVTAVSTIVLVLFMRTMSELVAIRYSSS